MTVALPKLRAFFGADLASVQWVLNGYVLALAALTLIGGALADHYGKARMLAVGCVGFGVLVDSLRDRPLCRLVDCLPHRSGNFGSDRNAVEPGLDRCDVSERRA